MHCNTTAMYGSVVWDTLQATDLMLDHHVLKYASQMLLANEVADKCYMNRWKYIPWYRELDMAHQYITWYTVLDTAHQYIPWYAVLDTAHQYIPWYTVLDTAHQYLPWYTVLDTAHQYLPW
jgi:hypothetical protein